MLDDETRRQIIEAFAHLDEREAESFKPEPWALPYDQIADAVDEFMGDINGFRYGDRVTVERLPMGRGVTWVVLLDSVEIGRVSIVPYRGGYVWSEKATAKRKPKAEIERERHALFADVLDDLGWHMDLRTGAREPGGRQKWRWEYWSDPTEKESVYLPEQSATLNRWRATWARVKQRVDTGSSYQEISRWLTKVDPELAVSPQTLRKICEAGEAGHLER